MMSKYTIGTWTKASPQKIVTYFEARLSKTPKWRVFKRLSLKRSLEERIAALNNSKEEEK